jgi:hypothetical protein
VLGRTNISSQNPDSTRADKNHRRKIVMSCNFWTVIFGTPLRHVLKIWIITQNPDFSFYANLCIKYPIIAVAAPKLNLNLCPDFFIFVDTLKESGNSKYRVMNEYVSSGE